MGKASRTKRERREAVAAGFDVNEAWEKAKDDPKYWEEDRPSHPGDGVDPPAHLENWVGFARARKDAKVVASLEGENDDITNAVQVWRDGQEIATVICNRVDRDLMLGAAQMAIPGYSADRVFLMMDSHYSNKPGPRPGTKWKMGEMQNLCDNEGACETGLITDAIFCVMHDKAGLVEAYNMPYHIHKTSRTIRWVDSNRGLMSNAGKGQAVVGIVPDAVGSFLAMPTMYEAAMLPLEEHATGFPAELRNDPELWERIRGQNLAESLGIDPESARAHIDAVATKMLLASGQVAVMLAVDETDGRAQILKRSLEDAPGVELRA